ncbi:MAG: ERF family protein [Candidatus Hodarchaeota archaeon]
MDEQQQEEIVENNNIVPYQSPGALLAIAIQKDFDIDRLSKLMDLQERWEKNEAKKAFVAAMTEFKKNPPQIIKDMHVEFQTTKGKTSYNHASLGNVVGAVTEALSQHQMSANWQTEQNQNAVKVTCNITHVAGHTESISITAPPDTSGTKNTIQAIGSTITYLQRYTLLAICGLATNEFEDDGRQGNVNNNKPQSSQQLKNNNNKDKNLVGKEIFIGNMLMALTDNEKDRAAELLKDITSSEDGKFKGLNSIKEIKSLKQANFIIVHIKEKYPEYDWKEFEKTGELVDLPIENIDRIPEAPNYEPF